MLLLTRSSWMKAQQRYDNQFVFGAIGNYIPSSGYGASGFIERYLGKSYSSLKLEGIYMNREITTQVKDCNVGAIFCGAGFSYGYSLEKYIFSPFYINLSVGGVGGYEKLSYDDSFIDIKASDNFIYGFTGSIQLEVIATKNLSFFIEPKAYYFLNSDLRRMNGSLGAGVKVYL